jgi:hypothetical protein
VGSEPDLEVVAPGDARGGERRVADLGGAVARQLGDVDTPGVAVEPRQDHLEGQVRRVGREEAIDADRGGRVAEEHLDRDLAQCLAVVRDVHGRRDPRAGLADEAVEPEHRQDRLVRAPDLGGGDLLRVAVQVE